MYKQLLMLLLLVNSLLCPTPTLATTTGEAVDAAYEELKALIKTKCGPSEASADCAAYVSAIEGMIETAATDWKRSPELITELKQARLQDLDRFLTNIAKNEADFNKFDSLAKEAADAYVATATVQEKAVYAGISRTFRTQADTAREATEQLQKTVIQTQEAIANTGKIGKVVKVADFLGKFLDYSEVAISVVDASINYHEGTLTKADFDKIGASISKLLPVLGFYSAYSDIVGITGQMADFFEKELPNEVKRVDDWFTDIARQASLEGYNHNELTQKDFRDFRSYTTIKEMWLESFLDKAKAMVYFFALNAVLAGKTEEYTANVNALKKLLAQVRELDTAGFLLKAYHDGVVLRQATDTLAQKSNLEFLAEVEEKLDQLAGLQEEYDREQSLAPFSFTPATVFKAPYQDATGQWTNTISPSGEINGDVSLEGGILDLQGQELVINGNLIHSGGNLKVNGGRLIVKGDYRIQKIDGAGGYGESNGSLLMNQSEDYVYVAGKFVTQQFDYYAYPNCKLSAGMLEVKGDFIHLSGQRRYSFWACDSHKVILSGSKLQTVSFEVPESNFAWLDITNSGEGVKFNPSLNALTLTTSGFHQLIPPVTIRYKEWNLTEDESIAGDLYLEGTGLDLNGKQLTVEGNLIHSGGRLRINGGRLIVKGDYRIQKLDGAGGYGESGGYLTMGKPEDYVYVGGNFVTQSKYDSPNGELVAGTLEVKGDFTQLQGNFGVFGAYEGHRVVLSGSKLQTVSFESPTGSRFLWLDLTNSGEGVKFNSPLNAITLTTSGSHQLIPPVTIRDTDWYLTADETIAGDLYLESAWLNLNGKQLTIEGNLIHSGGGLRVGGGRLVIKGDYRIQKPDGAGGYGASEGCLYMMDRHEDYIYVGGNFVTQSKCDSYGQLVTGTLEVKGDFTQKLGNNNNNFVGRDTHKVVLSGTRLQTVSFEKPEDSLFATLDITNTGEGIQFTTRVRVSTLFNHRGHPFTLSPNATPADFVDYDNDGLTDQVDPMPTSFNNLDTDQDGVVDELDAFPNDATEWADQDKDGIGDNVDDDNDNDGITDVWEQVHGLNPADPNDANLPSTTEGLTNLQLFQQTQARLNSQPSFAFLGQATAKNTQGEAIVTEAKFIGGLATDQTKYRKTQTVKLSDPVTVAGLIAAETGHLNQPAEIVVYAAYTPLSAPDSPPLYFMLDNNLGIQQWDENVNTLVPFQTVAALEDVAEIKMYEGNFIAPGFLKIYFGYRSPDGTVVVNGEPIEVEIME